MAQPILSQAYYQQGQAFYQKGEYQAALASFKLFLSKYPNNELSTSVKYNIGLCYLKLNIPAQAETVFERFVFKYPKHRLADNAWLALGKISFERKAYSQAAQHFTKVTASADKQVISEARYWLGECLGQQGQSDKALATFLEVIKHYADQFPWVHLARYQAAQIYANRGEKLAAQKLLLSVVQESDDNELAELAKQHLQQLLNTGSSQNKGTHK